MGVRATEDARVNLPLSPRQSVSSRFPRWFIPFFVIGAVFAFISVSHAPPNYIPAVERNAGYASGPNGKLPSLPVRGSDGRPNSGTVEGDWKVLPMDEAEQDLLARCGDAAPPTLSGLPRPPVESVVMMTMRAKNADAAWQSLLKAYISTPSKVDGPYHTFFRTHNVSMWEMPKVPYQVFYGERVSAPPTGKDAQVKPLRIDLVYTFVNPNTPSFQRAFTMCTKSCERARFTDWNEMLYSSRTAANHVLRSDAFTSGADPSGAMDAKGRPAREPLLNKVYILVADKDQAPEWMNFSHPALEIVTQNQTFGTFAGDINDYLPTFNSGPIDMTVHRVPNLNRFYIYSNNDNLFSRQLSFFDLFRPLSPERQALYRRHFTFAGYERQIKAPRGFVNLFFEPTYLSENWRRRYLAYTNFNNLTDTANDTSPSTNESSLINATTTVPMVDSPVYGPLPASCPPNVPLMASHFFYIPQRSRWKLYPKMEQYTRTSFLNNIGTIAPHIGYAHAPQLMDRLVTEEYIDAIGDEVFETLKKRERSAKNILMTNLMPLFAIASRRAVARLEVLRRDAWRRRTDEEVRASIAQMRPGISDMRNSETPTLRIEDLGPLQENIFSWELNGGLEQYMQAHHMIKNGSQLSRWDRGRLFSDVTFTPRYGSLMYIYTSVENAKGARELAGQYRTRLNPVFSCLNDLVKVQPEEEEDMKAAMEELLIACSRQAHPSEFEKQPSPSGTHNG